MSEHTVHNAQKLLEQGHIEQASNIVYALLKTDPNNFEGLVMLSHIMLETDKAVFAYNLCQRAKDLHPENASVWINMGMAARELWRMKEARRCYERGLKIAKNTHEQSMLHVNLSSLCVDLGLFEEAEDHCRKALALNPESTKAKANLGFSQLGQGKNGWANYRHCIGTDWRPLIRYNKEPLWDGESRGRIIIYGEQGLGDMICFGTYLKQMKQWCDDNESHLIVDIDPRLYNVFKRSFPDIEIYGTLGAKTHRWKSDADYSLPMGQLGEYFEYDPTPYLVPDEDRVKQWRLFFESQNKPAIGIAWTGGIPKTGAHFRKIDVEKLQPLFDAIDAHWVSLQYKPAGDCNPVHEYPYATLVRDYDATIAMVAALDAVVGVPTTVIHAAGCLGVRTIAMNAPVKCWKFASGVPFHPVTLIDHHDDWSQTIKDTASHLEDLCLESLSDTTRDNQSPTTSVSTPSSEILHSQSV